MSDIKNPKKLLLTIVVVVAVLLGATGLVLSARLDEPKQKASTVQQTAQKTPVKPAATSTVSYDGVEGKTALELLKTKATVVTKDSSYGEYVDTVNGVAGGTGGKYWAFYINGSLSQIGAGDYKTKSGDKIQWKFE